MHIVPLCLDSDPALIPLSCKAPATPKARAALGSNDIDEHNDNDTASSNLDILDEGNAVFTDPGGAVAPSDTGDSFIPAQDADPDDFTFWSERQAKRICMAIEQVFNVEYAPEVVVADANLTALANRILLSKEILTI